MVDVFMGTEIDGVSRMRRRIINEKLIIHFDCGELQTANQEWRGWFIARFPALALLYIIARSIPTENTVRFSKTTRVSTRLVHSLTTGCIERVRIDCFHPF
jgi:hypothetical protein